MRQLPIPATVSRHWPFKGGLDQSSLTLSVDPGRLRYALNVEVPTTGGVKSLQGYERADGRPKPSDAVYYLISATITGSYNLGDTLTGATSGATGVIIAAVTGSGGYFILTKVVGTFQNGETLNISGSGVATATSTANQGGASTQALNATYLNLAADEYRDDIAAVPGSGDVLGVWKYNSDLYAVRNNAGGTAAVMHKATTGGWTTVNLGRELAFTAGQTQLAVGATITGAVSGATAVIGVIVVTSGTLGAGTAAGFIYFASQTGAFQAENIQVGGVNRGTIAANSSAITLTADGRYEFINANFTGAAGSTKMYGCSGAHKAFQFDGTTFAFISTGMATDTPSHIAAHKKHLFLTFGASVQHSSPGDPLAWSAVTGAAEIAVGDIITSLQSAPGSSDSGALVIWSRNQSNVLYGNSSSDWNLVTLNPDAGAIEWTQQWIGQGVYLDDRGVTALSTSQRFGNFADADISEQVRPFVRSYINNAVASCAVRAKNQYRLFFSGGFGLYMTFSGGKVSGATPVNFPNPVACVCSLEAADGEEEIFFGSTNGMVYQLDKGTSFDGDAIAWIAELHFNHFGSPRLLKTWRKATIEVTGESYAEISIAYNIGYGTSDLPQSVSTSAATQLSSTRWDDFNFDQFYWDGQTLIPSEANLDGTAENISLVFSGDSDTFEPITLNGAIVDFTPRRPMR